MAERVEAIAQLRLQGQEYPEIAQFCAARGWPHGVSQTYLYIRRADALLDRYAETNRNRLFGQRIARRNALWSRALAEGNLALALAIEKDQTKLLGMYPEQPAKPGPGTQVQVNNVTPTISEEDREEIRRLALARLGEVDHPKDQVGQRAADAQVLPALRSDPAGRGSVAEQLADATGAGEVTETAASTLRTEQPVLAGPPGPGEERSVCLECGRRYPRRPGVVFHCPECNA
jgi:hypothetical protein